MRITEITKRPKREKREWFLRIGDLPENGKSTIHHWPNATSAMFRTSNIEPGISVYDVTFKDGKWEIDVAGNSTDELLHQVFTGNRKIYLVTGVRVLDDLGYSETGIDGEPLIKEPLIKKELTLYDIRTPGTFDYATEMDDDERAQYNKILKS